MIPATTATTATPPPRSKNLVFHFAGVVLLVLAAAAALYLATTRHKAEAHETSARAEELAKGPRVTVAPVTKLPPGRLVTLPGEVHAFRESTLYAKVSGYLKYIRVDKGDRVKAGDVLGVIEAPELEQQARSKQADVAIRKLTDARYKMLEKNGLVSTQDAERAQADLTIANADLAQLQALQGYQVIKAPFDGVITARRADEGALLQAATSSQSALSLVDVADIKRVRIFLYLAQADALFVREGDPVTLWTEERPEAKVNATVTRFAKELDARTRTMLTEVDIDNSTTAPLYPGTFVRASLTLATPESLAIPADALAFRKGSPAVAVLRDGRAVVVPVEAGDTDGRLVHIKSGVSEGDRIILHPGDDVADGTPVQVVEHPGAAH